MNDTISPQKKRNKLLLWLIGISLLTHLFMVYWIAGIYRRNDLTSIELTLIDIKNPVTRDIPRPRHRPKSIPVRPKALQRIDVTPKRAPSFDPQKIKPFNTNQTKGVFEEIILPKPDSPYIPSIKISEWNPGHLLKESTNKYASQEDYMNVVRLKIERKKRYPLSARARNLEGKVTVQFVLTPDGALRGVKLKKASSHEILNRAALKAIKDAAPFPSPPQQIFKGELSLELTIVFEMT